MLESGKTNFRDFMISQGFLEIYDCGKSMYVWKNETI